MSRMPWVSILVLTLGAASTAPAQFRNHIFSLGGGYEAAMRPLDNQDISGAPLVGGEYRFKMLDDHWWFNVGVQVGARSHHDPQGDAAIGTMLDVRPNVGLRYYFMTVTWRPFIQAGASVHTLFWFKSPADDVVNAYLPHPTWGTLNVQPGLEWVFMRNTAIAIGLDTQWMIFWNASDSYALYPNINIVWFM